MTVLFEKPVCVEITSYDPCACRVEEGSVNGFVHPYNDDNIRSLALRECVALLCLLVFVLWNLRWNQRSNPGWLIAMYNNNSSPHATIHRPEDTNFTDGPNTAGQHTFRKEQHDVKKFHTAKNPGHL